MKVFDLFSAAVKDAGVTIQPTLGETHFSLVYANQSNSSNFNKKLIFFFSQLPRGWRRERLYLHLQNTNEPLQRDAGIHTAALQKIYICCMDIFKSQNADITILCPFSLINLSSYWLYKATPSFFELKIENFPNHFSLLSSIH